MARQYVWRILQNFRKKRTWITHIWNNLRMKILSPAGERKGLRR
jgi:hypothetical protein